MTFQEFTFGLAPMEGVTDYAFRLWLWLASGPRHMTTPFLRATQSYPHRSIDPSFAPELTANPAAYPYRLVPQIMAADSEHFLRAAHLLLRHSPYVELNAGCPAPTCTGRGAGSSLLANAEAWHRFALRLSSALGPGRLAIKMRTGYQHASELPQLLEAVRELPLARLTIHGRTRPERYLGRARWDLVEMAAAGCTYPVIASGDVVDRASFRRLLQAAPSISGVIIGRGAMRHPFIFLDLDELEADDTAIPPWSSALLPQALACYGLLVELEGREISKLMKLADRGLWQLCLGRQTPAWEALTMQLAGALGVCPESPRDFAALGLSRQTLGRMKMLWNYWRSSLPTHFFAPPTMRAKEAGEFLHAIAALGDSWHDPLVAQHQEGHDWIYAGGKRPHQPEESCSVPEPAPSVAEASC